jgi:hypothetical protein
VDDELGDEPSPVALPKPDELLAAHGIATRLFDLLREWFDVGPSVTLNLEEIDSAVSEMGDPRLIAAMAMRKLQALHLISTPGVRTSTDIVVTIVNDLDRALVQAPSMYLALKAESTDWDRAFASLSSGELSDDDAPTSGTALDPEIAELAELHQALHIAVEAVIDAADGEIRYFE